jgi:glycosyltransferase involved in cell wall biosynthesis
VSTDPGDPPRRRVLIVSRELPPAIGPHPIRVAKLAKYLPRFGWDVTVLTVPVDHAWAVDASLLEDIRGTDVIRVARLLAGVIRPSDAGSRPVAGRDRGQTDPGAATGRRTALARWLIPDRDLLWAIPAARRARQVARGYDVVLTTAPPFSTHIVGAWVARRTGIPWVAEYRDNWTTNPLYRRTGLAGRLDRFVETHALPSATVVVTMSQAAADEMAARFPAVRGRVVAIPNGFDPEDMPVARARPVDFIVVYAGSLGEARDPRPLFGALAGMAATDSSFAAALQLRLVGNVTAAIATAARDAIGESRVVIDGLVPHRQALETAAGSAVLLAITTHREAGGSGLTSKLFEYLGLRRPILLLAPDGPARDLVAALDAGEVAEPDDEAAIGRAVQRLYQAWQAGSERVARPEDLEQLTRITTAARMADALERARVQIREGSSERDQIVHARSPDQGSPTAARRPRARR